MLDLKNHERNLLRVEFEAVSGSWRRFGLCAYGSSTQMKHMLNKNQETRIEPKKQSTWV